MQTAGGARRVLAAQELTALGQLLGVLGGRAESGESSGSFMTEMTPLMNGKFMGRGTA